MCRIVWKSSKGKLFWTWIGIQTGSLILMVISAFMLDIDLSWDWGALIHTASEYVLTGGVDRPEYYATYPNNRFWAVCLIAFFRMVKVFIPDADAVTFKVASTALGIFLIQISLFLLYRTACILFSERKAFLGGCAALLCAPLYVYSMFAYTDLSGMLAVSLFLYFYVKKSKTESAWWYQALLGILAALLLEIKIMAFIVCIAAMIADFFRCVDWKRYVKGIMAAGLSCVAVCFMVESGIEKVIPVTEELSDACRFPPAHWIMMGLKGEGGYDQEDVDHTRSFPTYEKKKESAEAVIKQRVEEFGFLGMTDHLIKKIKRTWGDGTLASSSYCNRKPFHSDGMLFQFFSEDGRHHWIMLIYTGLYHGILLLGILLSGVWAWKKHDGEFAIGRICIFGIVLFLLIWECNSRYLVVFFPVLLLTAAEGWFGMRDYWIKLQLQKREKERRLVDE